MTNSINSNLDDFIAAFPKEARRKLSLSDFHAAFKQLTASPCESLVDLKAEYTCVEVSEETKQRASMAAHLVTMSPHEWVWSQQDQEAMAAYVLWASQRLEAIKRIAAGCNLTHQP